MWPISATLAVRPIQLALQILGFPVSSNGSQNDSVYTQDIMNKTDKIDLSADHASVPIPQYMLHARAPMQHADVNTWENINSTSRDTKAKRLLEPINMTAIKDQDTWPPFYSAKSPLNYCGDTTEYQDLDATGPDVADCAALKGIVDYEPGYWDVTANVGGNGYMLITSHGTCGFVVKPWNNAADLL